MRFFLFLIFSTVKIAQNSRSSRNLIFCEAILWFSFLFCGMGLISFFFNSSCFFSLKLKSFVRSELLSLSVGGEQPGQTFVSDLVQVVYWMRHYIIHNFTLESRRDEWRARKPLSFGARCIHCRLEGCPARLSWVLKFPKACGIFCQGRRTCKS